MNQYQHLIDKMKADSKGRFDAGLKGYPSCEFCQCYPEGRADCQDHQACRDKLRAPSTTARTK